MTQMIWNKPDGASRATLLLAHGAGAPMDTPFMTGMAERLAARGVAVARFEFAYMAARRGDGKKRPPPHAEKLIGEFQAAASAIVRNIQGPLLIGGKSLGGRVAAMLGGSEDAGSLNIRGVVCLGYPLHPPGKPDRLRLAPLQGLTVPAVICQGERDPFGTSAEVATYDLPDSVSINWMTDGDHDLKPRKKSGATSDGNLDAAADAVAEFAKSV